MANPLTPPDCDLRGLSYMPLDVQRLRDSDLALTSTGDEFKAAVLLWCVSWSQVPAASLPADDRLIARLIGFEAKSWGKVKGAALRGWIKCDDGRLYHPVVAEKAREAWTERLKHRAKRDKDNARLAAWRASQQHSGNGDGNASETRDETRFETSCETLPEEEGTGSGGIREESKASSLSGAAAPGERRSRKAKTPIPDGYPDAEAVEAAEGWIALARVSLDAKAHAQRFRQHALANGRTAADWGEAWRGWIGIELETAPPAAADAKPKAQWPGPPEIRATVIHARDEGLAIGYLDRCRWRDLPDKAIIAPNSFTADTLRKSAGDALADLGVLIVVEAAA